MNTKNKKNVQRETKYFLEHSHVTISCGETIVMLRNLKGWTQEELARKSGIAATNLSRLENGHLSLGKQRAIILAKALGVHPATLMFPEIPMEKAA
jgi:transcriptional regulator with XRE-family HTH domain